MPVSVMLPPAADVARSATLIATMRLHVDAGRHDDFGSSAPSGTISRTWTIVHFAADAMTGPKLRAVLR
jgi:hypothetical protein